MPELALLVDMNLPPSLANALSAAGYSAVHVRNCGLAAASDEAIVAYARAQSRIVVTNDLDFSRILAVDGTTTPSVLVLRLRDTKPARVAALLVNSLPKLTEALSVGAIVVVEDAAIRVRLLPVAGSP